MGKMILTDIQNKFLEDLRKEKNLLKKFYLTGGTALSEFYLEHRYSEDLDFFTPEGFNLKEVFDFVEKFAQRLNLKLVYQSLYDRRIFYLKEKNKDKLKVEFTKYPYKQLREPKVFAGLRVDTLFDIGVNKLFSIFDRFEEKDFVDLYFISKKKLPIKRLRKGVEEKFNFTVETITLGSELLKARRIRALPKMIRKVQIAKIINFFEEETKKLSSQILS